MRKPNHELDTLLDLEDPDYRSIEAISQSGMRMYATEGPWAYYSRIVAKTHHTPVSKAMELGRAGHRFLEVDCDVEKVFAVNPTKATDKRIIEMVNSELDASKSGAKRLELGDRLENRAKAHKRYKHLATQDISPDLVIVDEDKLNTFKESVQALQDSTVCRDILLGSGEKPKCEVSIVRQIQTCYFKCRCDILFPDRVGDYKFTKHRHPSKWKKDAKYDGSFFQALYYMQLFDRPRFTWFLICNQAPHEAFAVTLSREALESDSSGVAQWCNKTGSHRSIKSIADGIRQDMIDSYDHNIWHPDAWYNGSDVEESTW